MERLTMEQINKGLMNGGVAGKLANKRQMMNELKELRTEVKEEVKDMNRDRFMEVVRFMNSVTVEDVYNVDVVEEVVDTIPTIEAEVVGVIGHGIECSLYEEDEDRVELPSWCVSHATEGVRYTEPLLAPLV